MIFTHGHEKIYFSYFVYEHHMYRSVTIWTLEFYPLRLHYVINIVNQNALSSKHMLIIFYRENSQLRHSYAKDPLCMTRLTFQTYTEIEIYTYLKTLWISCWASRLMPCSDPFQMSMPCLSPNPNNYSFFGLVSRQHPMKTPIQSVK